MSFRRGRPLENHPTEKNEGERERPPFFSSWGRLYAAVLLNLALQILLFIIFTRAFK
jgi:hypothetical protein